MSFTFVHVMAKTWKKTAVRLLVAGKKRTAWHTMLDKVIFEYD